jgi:hypothetical protein
MVRGAGGHGRAGNGTVRACTDERASSAATSNLRRCKTRSRHDPKARDRDRAARCGLHRPRLALRQPVRGRAHVDQHLSGRWHRCRHLPQRHDFRTADVQKLYGLHEISSHLHVARQDYRAGNGSANTSTARAESVRAVRRPARSPRCKASADRPATHAPL